MGIFYILILRDYTKYEPEPQVHNMKYEWRINIKPTTPSDASCVNAESIMTSQHKGAKEQEKIIKWASFQS
jgi:hypothetical protein